MRRGDRVEPLPVCADRLSRIDRALFGNGHPEESLIVKVNQIEEQAARTEQRLTSLMEEIRQTSKKAVWWLIGIVLALVGNWATNVVGL